MIHKIMFDKQIITDSAPTNIPIIIDAENEHTCDSKDSIQKSVHHPSQDDMKDTLLKSKWAYTDRIKLKMNAKK